MGHVRLHWSSDPSWEGSEYTIVTIFSGWVKIYCSNEFSLDDLLWVYVLYTVVKIFFGWARFTVVTKFLDSLGFIIVAILFWVG